jgi:hypothetical protein
MLVAVWVGAGCFAYVNIVNATTARAEELAEGVLAGSPSRPTV